MFPMAFLSYSSLDSDACSPQTLPEANVLIFCECVSLDPSSPLSFQITALCVPKSTALSYSHQELLSRNRTRTVNQPRKYAFVNAFGILNESPTTFGMLVS